MAIRLEDVKKTYPARDRAPVTILDVRRFEVEAGRHLCLVGGSGSGKTTLLNVIAGIVTPTEGRVLFDDVDITTLSESERDRFRARNIGYVFQTFNLLQGLTAIENVLIAQAFAGRKGGAAREQARALLDRMGLSHRLDARPGTMSVGEQQRVAIARAVVNGPRIVLADEPTANLDEANSGEVLALLKEVASEQGSILLLVTHDRAAQEAFDDVTPIAEIVA